MRGSSSIFVLGRFRPASGLNYIQRAGVWDASYFNPPGYIRKSLTKARLWQVNAEAIRQAVRRGETVRVGTKVNWDDSRSWLFREMDLLWEEFDLVLVESTFFSNR